MSDTNQGYTYDPEAALKECWIRHRDERIKNIYGEDFLNSLSEGKELSEKGDEVIYKNIKELVDFVNEEVHFLEPEPTLSITINSYHGKSLNISLFRKDIEILCRSGSKDCKEFVKLLLAYKLNQYLDFVKENGL